MIQIFGRELMYEQIRCLVRNTSVDGQITLPADWIYQLIDQIEASKKKLDAIMEILT
jgi:tRNA U38,U39,U40 pseudouridine synthase TruA